MLKRPNIYDVEDIKQQTEYIEKQIKNPYYFIKMPGQLKLLLNEIRFLTEDIEIHNMKDKKFTLLYIGSGKGYHIPYLITLYEHYNIEWVFFDPNGHCEKLYEYQKLSKAKIIIRDEYFTDSNIEEFKNTENIILISDIRSTSSSKDQLVDVSPETKDLLFDYKLQNNILKELKPLFSLLKFRMPFPTDWKDGYEFEKPIGKEYIQAFQKTTSAECRIFLNSVVVFENINNIEKLKEYEEKLFWYNNYYRFQHNNDLNIAHYIFQNYYNAEVPKKIINRKDIIKFLTKIHTTY